MKKILISLSLTCLAAPCASAANFLLITDHPTTDGYLSFLNTTNFPGSTVTAGKFNDHEAQSTLNAVAAADVIIFSRDTTSNDYIGTGEVTYWNSVTKPIVLSSSYLLRVSRFGWQNNDNRADNIVATGSETTLTAAGATYFGLMAGANDLQQVDSIDATAGDSTFGEGVVFGTLSGGPTAIVHWNAGDEAANGDVFGGERLFFATNLNLNLSATGTTALKGAINNMIPEPGVSVLSALTLGAMALRRRRA